MAANRRPTLADVAREVGVSAKTVSRVLNEDGPASAETREQVLAAVAKLGFQPNLMARNIRVGGPDTTIGLVIPDLANPFFGAVARAIEDVVGERGLTLLMGSSADDPERERALTDKFLARRVSILIVVPSVGADHSHLKSHRTAGLPIVFLDRPGVGLPADSIVSSNRAGAQDGIAHLIAHGHHRIGFVGDLPVKLYTRRERLAGYRAALQEADIPYDRSLVANAHDQPAPRPRPPNSSTWPIPLPPCSPATTSWRSASSPNSHAASARTWQSSPSTTYHSPRPSNRP